MSLRAILASAAICAHVALFVPAALAAGEGAPRAGATLSADEYMKLAAAGDLYEREAGRLAMQKAVDGEVRRLGRQMVQDHMLSSEKIGAAARSINRPAPVGELTPEQQSMLRRLTGATGSDFDRLYLDLQVRVHRQAVVLHRDYARHGDEAALKKAAAEIMPVVERHLAQFRRLASP